MVQETYNIDALRKIAPAHKIAPVTPDDNADLPDGACDALFVKEGGQLAFTASGGGTDSWPVLAGDYVQVQVIRVLATGTTAGVTALY